MSDRILVTGPFGQIGSDLIPELQRKHGHDNVVALGHRNIPDDFAREYIETFHSIDESTPLLEALGGGVWSTGMLVDLAGVARADPFRDSPVYNDFYVRYGLRDAIGFAVLPRPAAAHAPRAGVAAGPSCGAMLTCFRESFGSEGFADRGLAILRLLRPVLEVGVAGRIDRGTVPGALEVGLDSVRDGIHVCDADGRHLHSNAALTRTLRQDPESERITAAVHRVRARMGSLLREGMNGEALANLAAVSIELRTLRARYSVTGHFAAAEPFGAGPAIVVSVQRLTPELPSHDRLREWWGLSHQEARVALLIATGMTNAQVAATLGLSSSTARHYTESVFLKLEVTSRAEAAYTVLSR